MLMAGADVTMLCSILLRRGIEHIRVIEREMREWMEEHEYESISQLRGSMSQVHVAEPAPEADGSADQIAGDAQGDHADGVDPMVGPHGHFPHVDPLVVGGVGPPTSRLAGGGRLSLFMAGWAPDGSAGGEGAP